MREPWLAEFLEHATQEQEHADRIAERITQLGGEPDFQPHGSRNEVTPSMWKAKTCWT
jgi:bacterioferritin (cytochrome b1)